jgi:hypothetical protein
MHFRDADVVLYIIAFLCSNIEERTHQTSWHYRTGIYLSIYQGSMGDAMFLFSDSFTAERFGV